MRSIVRMGGIFLIIVGGIQLVVALNMDTSVDAGGETIGSGDYAIHVPQTRVHNIGLMSERQNRLIVGGMMVVMGILIVGFTELLEPKRRTVAPQFPKCPRCNGELEGTPELCRHCRSELRWIGATPYTPEGATRELARQEQVATLREQQSAGEKAAATPREKQSKRMRQAREDAIRQVSSSAANTAKGLLSAPFRFDAMLKKSLGEENAIIYRFVQCLLYAVIPAAAIAVYVLLIR